jgi:hypothetical protein
MLFKNWWNKDQNGKIAGKIKKELMLNFQKKGINISRLHIDTKFNRLNVEVCIKSE